ncbi:MAG: TfoX/Sxy family protein [Anaeroplasmataceae bacterium]|nr:TfoX/Sxy family protein [Anaeroplasmataceae bacterium]
MTNLTSMKNIGKEMANKLISVGIETKEKLIQIGSKEAFLKIKKAYPNVCLVHLYTLEGAIQDIEFNRLSVDTKKELKAFNDSI